jgi:hypothetical protein
MNELPNVKVQSSNKAQNPNKRKFSSFGHLSLIWHLDFDI